MGKFTYQKTDFLNGKTYNEQSHSDALYNGLPNFSNFGLEYNKDLKTVTNGRGINGGVPFLLGKSGEKQSVTSNFTGFLVIKSVMNGFNSKTELIEMSSVPDNTTTIKYFAIYELNNGSIVNDLRHSEYIKSVDIKNVDDNNFQVVINGTSSNNFSVGLLQNAYDKSFSTKYFTHSYKYYNSFPGTNTDEDFKGFGLGHILNVTMRSLDDEYLTGYQANMAVTLSIDSAAPNTYLAIKNVLKRYYGVDTGDSNFYKISLITYGSNINAGTEMQISTNADGKIYKFTLDNYGPSYTTQDADYIKAQNPYYGELNAVKIISDGKDISKTFAKNGDFTEFINANDYKFSNTSIHSIMREFFNTLDGHGIVITGVIYPDRAPNTANALRELLKVTINYPTTTIFSVTILKNTSDYRASHEVSFIPNNYNLVHKYIGDNESNVYRLRPVDAIFNDLTVTGKITENGKTLEERFTKKADFRIWLNKNDKNYVGKNLANILRGFYATLEPGNSYVITGLISATATPNTAKAIKLLLEDYNVSYGDNASYSITIVKHDEFITVPHEIAIIPNGEFKVYRFIGDNIDDTTYKIQRTRDNVYELHTEKLFVNGVQPTPEPNRSFIAFNGASFYNNTSTVHLTSNGYTTDDIEKITLIFSRYTFKNGTVGPNNDYYSQYEMTNTKTGIGYDAFYGKRCAIVPGGGTYVDQENKTFDLNSDWTLNSVITGDYPISCLRAVYVTIREEKWKPSLGKTTQEINSYLQGIPTIQADRIPDGQGEIFLKTDSEAYNVYDMASAELNEFKKQYFDNKKIPYKILNGEVVTEASLNKKERK